MDLADERRTFALRIDPVRALQLIAKYNEPLLLSLGGIYTALYARFASQWNYLANLYNQMMQVGVSAEHIQRDKMARWKAGFVEDAYSLHLAQKPMFAEVVAHLLVDPEVRGHVVDSLTATTVNELEDAVRQTLRQLGRRIPTVVVLSEGGE
jgi:hypothetical protein